ncbi:MAG: hypothetical protein KUG57_02440 [Ilumatobacteraceae bacterium]|nr:hypothetical protein [Ilumatobacteraceae bacterium]
MLVEADDDPDDELSEDDLELLVSEEPELSELVDPESLDEELSDDLSEEGALPFEFDSPDAPPDDLPRLSVLKKPDPLNVTPTGWNTFLTAISSPDSGWATSASVSSVKDC